MTYEYGVVIRRQRKGEPAFWQVWTSAGCIREGSGFLAVMDWAGARGFEAFAAGNFDELGVPEVLLRRSVASPPPPPLPRASGKAGGEFETPAAAAKPGPAQPKAARKPASRPRRPKKKES